MAEETTAVKTKSAKPVKKVKSDKPKAERKVAAGAPKGPRAAPEGFVSLGQLAQKLGVPAPAARRKLRGSELAERAEGRFWAWKEGSKDLAKATELLSA
jgi:hypothetical protein